MTEFLSILTHGRRLKAAIKELPSDELTIIKERLEEIISNKIEEEKQAEQELAKRQQELNDFIAQAKALNVSAEELAELLGGAKAPKKREPRPAKYSITIDGETTTWTGQGRMPNVFKEAIESSNGSKTIESFAI